MTDETKNETKTKNVGHKDSQGRFFSCCDPKIKRASERYPLHARYMLDVHGVTAEQYDRQAKEPFA